MEAARGSKNRLSVTKEIRGVYVSATRFYYNMLLKRRGLLESIKRKLHASNIFRLPFGLMVPHHIHINIYTAIHTLALQQAYLSFLVAAFIRLPLCLEVRANHFKIWFLLSLMHTVSDVDQLARVQVLTYEIYREILENRSLFNMTGIRVGKSSGQDFNDRTVSNNVVKDAWEFIGCDINA